MPHLLARFLVVAGVAALIAAAAAPWFTVPVADWMTGSVGVGAQESASSTGYRVLCLLTVLAWTGGRYVFPTSRIPARVLCVTGVSLLFFPYFTMVWCPQVAGQAAWLQEQHTDLVSSGGEISRAQEYHDLWWGRRLYADALPLPVAAIRNPEQISRLFRWGNLGLVLNWLGYSSVYCQFLRVGWGLALAGVAAILIGNHRSSSPLDVRRLLGKIAVLSGVATGCALAPHLIACVLMTRVAESAQSGSADMALRDMVLIGRILPSFRESTFYVVQKGMLDSVLGLNTYEARLNRAEELRSTGRYSEERQIDLELLSSTLPETAIQREAMKALLRQAASEFNSGEFDSARDDLKVVLRADPSNIKGNFMLQRLCLYGRQRVELAEALGRLTAVYHYFNSLEKRSVLSAAWESVAFAGFLDGDLREAELALRRSKGNGL